MLFRSEKQIEQSGYTSCIVTVIADVERVKNNITIVFDEDFFHIKENDEVKFKGKVNKVGYLTVFNFYEGIYSKIYTVNIASQTKDFVIPSTNTNKIVARLPDGKSQSKEMVTFLFTENVVDMKSSYNQREMRNLIYSIPYESRKVINRYVNIVK